MDLQRFADTRTMIDQQVKRIGVHEKFGHSGPAAERLKAFGLCSAPIVTQVMELMERNSCCLRNTLDNT